jgi:hypothetical protein
MAITYKRIASATVGAGGAASIDLTAIPSTFTDLKIELSSRLTTASEVQVRFNTLTTNLSDRVLYAIAGVGTASNTSATIRLATCSSTDTANAFGTAYIYVANYTSSNYKSVVADSAQENNSSTAYTFYVNVGLWSSSSVITSVNLFPSSGNFAQYSTATLYGILKA